MNVFVTSLKRFYNGFITKLKRRGCFSLCSLSRAPAASARPPWLLAARQRAVSSPRAARCCSPAPPPSPPSQQSPRSDTSTTREASPPLASHTLPFSIDSLPRPPFRCSQVVLPGAARVGEVLSDVAERHHDGRSRRRQGRRPYTGVGEKQEAPSDGWV